MKGVEFLNENSVHEKLDGAHKGAVIRELSQLVASAGGVKPEDVEAVLLAREELGSTGIGDGVAIPHGTLPGLKGLTAAFGRSVAGIDFDSSDGMLTHLFFVLLTPDGALGLQALARVSRMMRKSDFRERLVGAADRAAMYDILREGDG